MENDELKNEIERLQEQVNALKKTIDENSYYLKYHEHNNADKSKNLSSSLLLDMEAVIASGKAGLTGKYIENYLYRLGFFTGPEDVRGEAWGSFTTDTNLILEHQYSGIKVFYGYSHTFAQDTASFRLTVTKGTNRLENSNLSFRNENFSNHLLIISKASYSPGEITTYGYWIQSNSPTSITIYGTFDFTGPVSAIIIFEPLYLGTAFTPWRRLWVCDENINDGNQGGIMFGKGQVGNGQNSLLFVDKDGKLKYKNRSGTITTLAS